MIFDCRVRVWRHSNGATKAADDRLKNGQNALKHVWKVVCVGGGEGGTRGLC
jgi:hypothetical protein